MAFLNIFSNKKIKENKSKIIADNREKNSLVISELINLNNKVEFEQLNIGDYLVGDIAIERKTKSDLISSIIDKRIFSQLENLKKYANCVLMLEDNSQVNNFSDNAFKGFMLSIAIKFKVPIIYSKNEKDTAKYISILANKKSKKENPLRPNKRIISDKEIAQFILEGFPNIGPAKSKELIKKFKTLKNIANAELKDLRKVLGKDSDNIYRIFNQEFQS